MKKYISILLAVLLVLCFSACNQKEKPADYYEDDESISSDYFAEEGDDTSEIIEDYEEPEGEPDTESSDTTSETDTESTNENVEEGV